MRTTAKLIKKEKLRSNYKLTFNNKQGNIFVILYKTQQAIFTSLRTEIDYCFSYFQGKKYFFIKPLSIKEFRQTSFTPVRKLNAKNFLLNKLRRELRKSPKNSDFLNKTQHLIKTLFLKHQNNLDAPFFSLSEQDRKEIQVLNELRTLFFVDYIH